MSMIYSSSLTKRSRRTKSERLREEEGGLRWDGDLAVGSD